MDEALERLPARQQDVSVADVAVQNTRFIRKMMPYTITSFSFVSGNTPCDLLTSNSVTETRHKLL